MPHPEKQCRYCGAFVSTNNFSRHLRRWHPEQCLDELSLCNTPSRSSSRTAARVPMTSSCPAFNEGYIRHAALCMLRREEGNNVPAMSRYLETFFPEIPEAIRMPVIVATFTAAQKVTAIHGDTLLQGDDDRISWARRSLTRWAHGLSGVEPNIERVNSRNSTILIDDYDMSTAAVDISVLPGDSSVGGHGDAEMTEPPTSLSVQDGSDATVQLGVAVNDAEEPGKSAASGSVSVESIVSDEEPGKSSSTSTSVQVQNQAVGSLHEISSVSDSCPNVFDSRCLPVPMESSFAQADVTVVLKDIVAASVNADPALDVVDDGSDGVLVSDSVPDVESLLHSDIPPSMPVSFDDLEQFLCPVSVVLTPISTPKSHHTSDENPTDPVMNLFPSPHPSLEEDMSDQTTHTENRSLIRDGKLKGIKIKRKEPRKETAEKENAPYSDSTSEAAKKSTKESTEYKIPEKSQSETVEKMASETTSSVASSGKRSEEPRSETSKTAKESASSTARSDESTQDQKRPKSVVTKDFRIPFKPRNEPKGKSDHRVNSPKRVLASPRPGEKRKDLCDDRNQRYDKHVKPAFQNPTRDRINPRNGWFAPPRPYVHPAEIAHSRLTSQQLEWLSRMPRRWN